MDKFIEIWPSKNMKFDKIKNEEFKVTICWSHKFFEDYRKMSYDFFECGNRTFEEVINGDADNVKADGWFLAGVYLFRQSIELGLKALICRTCKRNPDIQALFEECCHDLARLFQSYLEMNRNTCFTESEKDWLEAYLMSLESVDVKSDIFRFPFEGLFIEQHNETFLNNLDVANNLAQAFFLIRKEIEEGFVRPGEEFDESLKTEFLIFSTHGIGNCYIRRSPWDRGFYLIIEGYKSVIDYIFEDKEINNSSKIYPMMFLCRNTVELCLKQLLYRKVEKGVPVQIIRAKRKSHLIIKDLWKNVKPAILNHARIQGYDLGMIEIVEAHLKVINSLDKNGDNFRYPTSYSLEYRIDNMTLDLKNVYEYMRSIINFLDGCNSMLEMEEETRRTEPTD